jgi:hypothetical protein
VEKRERSRLESAWRRTKSDIDLAKFKTQSKRYAKLLTSARRSYYRALIEQHRNSPRKLWSAMNGLLSRKSPPVLPSSVSNSLLASSFLSFFSDKITKLCSTFKPNVLSFNSSNTSPSTVPPPLLSFDSVSSEEVRRAILSSSDATCPLDPIPTNLLKSCLDVLLDPITKIVNLSFSSAEFPSSFKQAHVTPLLKKYNLPSEDLGNYRPISNLNFVSKIIERIIYLRLSSHLSSFSSITPYQSAYRPFHSTESALLYIQNDILLATDKQKLTALVLLDLSAAFDTIDHNILLNRLSSYCGISGAACSKPYFFLTY